MSLQKRTKEPAKVAVIENQKGGVGKTTIGYHLSCYLAEQGYRVLGIDLDPQGNFSSRFLTREQRTQGLRSVHLFAPSVPSFAVLPTAMNVDLIYALDRDVELANIERMELGQSVANFYENLDGIRNDYDFIVIDTPPAHGNKMTAASIASSHMFIPVELAAFAVTGLESVLETLSEIGQLIKRPVKITGVICNRVRRVKAHTEALEELRNAAGHLNVLENQLPTNGAIDDALRLGLPVWRIKATGAHRESGKLMLSLMKECASLLGARVMSKQQQRKSKQQGVHA